MTLNLFLCLGNAFMAGYNFAMFLEKRNPICLAVAFAGTFMTILLSTIV